MGHDHKKKKEFNPLSEKGWIKFLILRLLYEGPKHGYQLANELVERGYIEKERLSIGSIYILLKRAEKFGSLTSTKEISEGRERKVYAITEHGKENLKKGLEAVFKRRKVMDNLAEFYDNNFEE